MRDARDERGLTDLGAAMVVLAEADGRRRGLGATLLRLLDSELLMRNSIYSMGKEAGVREGKLEGQREGKLEGQREGLGDGEAKGLRRAIDTACDLLGVELTVARQKKVAALDVEGLSTLLARLRTERRWPR